MESKAVSSDYVLQQLRWRYATKKFDSTKKIPQDSWLVLKQAMMLAPSSFGLQPWKFALIESQPLKEKLVEYSWGQKQPAECSHFVVFLVRTSIDASYVRGFMDRVAEVRGFPVEKLAGYQTVIEQFIGRLDAGEARGWMARQVYIALGQLMMTAAQIGIDACPMEGINPEAYNRELGLDGTGYSALVACAIGYRDPSDTTASLPKVRFAESDLFVTY